VTKWVCKRIAQNIAQDILGHNFYWGKKLPKYQIWANAAIFKKNLPKVDNRLMGENSPNLVTLLKMPTYLAVLTQASQRSPKNVSSC
jgi:hypothetical protein